jgi:hypothetical protein
VRLAVLERRASPDPPHGLGKRLAAIGAVARIARSHHETIAIAIRAEIHRLRQRPPRDARLCPERVSFFGQVAERDREVTRRHHLPKVLRQAQQQDLVLV